MKLTKELILKSIEDRKKGNIEFENTTLNIAIDLILDEGMSIDRVLSMSEDEIETFYDSTDEEMYGGIKCTCHSCGRTMFVYYDGENFEGYTGLCDNCGKWNEIDVYGLE